jgi:DNA-binding transcriptional regulator YiaG
MDDNLAKIINGAAQALESSVNFRNSEKPSRNKSSAARVKNPVRLVAVRNSNANDQSAKPVNFTGRVKKPTQIGGGVLYPVPSKRVLEAFRKGTPSGENIKAFRLAIKLNIKDFATFIGVDPATVFRWETQRTVKLQKTSNNKVLKLVNNIAAGKKIRLPQLKLISG